MKKTGALRKGIVRKMPVRPPAKDMRKMTHVNMIDTATGRAITYRVRGIDELTVKDWCDISYPPVSVEASDVEATIQLIQRWLKIPRRDLMRLQAGEMTRLVTGLGQMLGHAAKMRIDAWNPPKEWKYKGKTYVVPQDLEEDTVWGQWVELNAALDDMKDERDLLPMVCAHLLTEKDKPFDTDDIPTRLAVFRAAPVEFPMKLTVFFLDSGSRLHDCMSRFMRSQVMSALQLLQQVQIDIRSATDGSASSINSPN